MPTDEMDNLDLLEQVENQALKCVLNMADNDENRAKKISEIETISKVRNNYEQNEQNRLNNNAKNDIEEEKLAVERMKIELEHKKIKVNVGSTVLYFLASCAGTWTAYNMEEVKLAFKPLIGRANEWYKSIIKR